MSSRATAAGTALRWIGLIGITAIAVMRSLVAFAPRVWFDMDPALYPSPLAALSPAGSITLDLLLILAAACALLGEALSRRGLDWRIIILAAIPLSIVLWHGSGDLGNLWLGLTWQSAAVAAVAAAHLARDRTMRAIMIALLIAVIAPLLVRGVAQVTYEHADTVRAFEEHRVQFLADRGWEEDSAQARIYERRLRQPQPTAWFTTTNIFASLAMVGLIVAAGLALAAHRAGLPSGWAGVAVLVALVAAAGVWLSGSKGAQGAAAIGLVIAILPLVWARTRGMSVRIGPALLLALPVLALLGVIARGTVLPEAFLGEKSLLFRWHYLVSSSAMFADHAVTGVGPDGYQTAYSEYRLPRNPEEVTSAHSVFIDWLCTLGVLGAAWIALAITLLWRAGRSLREPVRFLDEDAPEDMLRRLARCAFVVTALAIVPAMWVELGANVLDPLGLTMRLLGAAGFIGMTILAGIVAVRADRMLIDWPLAAAAGALLMHGQIEMTFTQPGTAVWCMVLLGVAGGALVRPAKPIDTRAAVTIAALAGALVIAIAAMANVPAHRQQLVIREAAAALHPLSEHAAGQIEQRREAARRLLDAYEHLPWDVVLLHEVARQYERAAAIARGDERYALLEDARGALDRAIERHDPRRTYGRRSAVLHQMAIMRDEPALWEQAIEDARALTRADPHGNIPWRWLGDVLRAAGRPEEAARAYERALQADENFELDPLKQFSPDERAAIEARLAETRGES